MGGAGRGERRGTIQEPQQYEFTDDRPPVSLSYYRLRQVDYDGQYEYSPVVTVTGKAELSPFGVSQPGGGVRFTRAARWSGRYLRAELYDARTGRCSGSNWQQKVVR
ncbi:MAG: hypothetical protein H6556_23030 [Lewinellaceae bacterium]|nr:hypothetical protein [Lewinellaceae bacterium]